MENNNNNNNAFHIINSPNLSYLRISNANSGNQTKWNISCLAENEHGRDEMSKILNIIPGIKYFRNHLEIEHNLGFPGSLKIFSGSGN